MTLPALLVQNWKGPSWCMTPVTSEQLVTFPMDRSIRYGIGTCTRTIGVGAWCLSSEAPEYLLPQPFAASRTAFSASVFVAIWSQGRMTASQSVVPSRPDSTEKLVSVHWDVRHTCIMSN